jgi:hypothetical protein
MQTIAVEIARKRARDLYRAYKGHAHHSKPVDDECRRAYQLLAQGRLIIKAIESVGLAGVKTEGADAGFPKLALCRADALSCKINMNQNGSATMHAGDTEPRSRERWGSGIYQSRNVFSFPIGTFTQTKQQRWRGEALLPTPPVHLRPKRGLANYHVLWEAEWTKSVPHDPMLLRRIGRADLWLVVASWELTEVERAVLSTRISA